MTEVLVSVTVPELATKQLRFRKKGDARVLTLSSNWLRLFGFEAGDPVVEKSLGPGKGITVERVRDLFTVQSRPKRVYQRAYKRRMNAPLETI